MDWWLLPLQDADVLVAGERVLYRQRRHWAALLPEFLQFLAALFLCSAFSMRGTTGLNAVLLIGSVTAVAVLWPLLRRKRYSTGQIVMLGLLAMWVVQADIGLAGVAALIVLLMALRFIVRVLRWAVYQRTYLTDRRLMEVDGFFGIEVNSMPLNMVTDVMLRRTPVGEVLGYGTFRVESAGQDQALSQLDFLLYAEDFLDMVVSSPTWRPH